MTQKTNKKSGSSRTSKKAVSARSSRSAGTSSNHVSHGGMYTTPRGSVSLMIPPFWSFRQTNDDLELESPSTHTTVVVTAFKRNSETATLNSHDYMQRFLRTAPAVGRKTIDLNTKARTIARFKDAENTAWQVEFFTDGHTLLLATLNTSEASRSPEARTGTAILSSIKLRKNSR